MLTEESRLANFTNELGVDGTVRYLRNIMGLWLLQECLRDVEGRGPPAGPGRAARRAPPRAGAAVASSTPATRSSWRPDDMPERIADGLPPHGPARAADPGRDGPLRPGLAWRSPTGGPSQDAQRLSGRDVDVVHIVGGGARNALLCQLTADACGLPVVAGPAEAAALGNVLVQARPPGVVQRRLGRRCRALLRTYRPLRRYAPAGRSRRPGTGPSAAAPAPQPRDERRRRCA